MENIKNIVFSGYKSFKEENVLQHLKNVNIIIGKNNCGKSSILDVMEYLFAKDDLPKIKIDELKITQNITMDAILKSFDSNISGGSIGGNHLEFGKTLEGKEFLSSFKKTITTEYRTNPRAKIDTKYIENDTIIDSRKNCDSNWKRLSSNLISSISSYNVCKIAAERDITKEDGNINSVSETGMGITSLIYKYLTYSEKDEKLIDEKLLSELNFIMAEDAHFDDIKIQQVKSDENYLWEIFLTEGGNRFELSKMGSGLKTIIIMLINLLVLPTENTKKPLFLFEELENNLHPALQRRVFEYLYNYAQTNDCLMFITTHSHVAINCFYQKEKASIYHVEKNNNKSSVLHVANYLDKISILEDLEVKASDLFQSNGIIWVEGPSDRVYIKKWLSIIYPELKENVHYQFIYYGGRLLYRYTADEENDLIDILLTNHNSIIVIDSDKRTKRSKINNTKLKIKNQFEEKNLYCWITKGKEIENYILSKDINLSFDTELPQVDTYELFPEYIKNTYKNFEFNKVKFAEKVVEIMNKESLNIMDLKKNIVAIGKLIKKWNKL